MRYAINVDLADVWAQTGRIIPLSSLARGDVDAIIRRTGSVIEFASVNLSSRLTAASHPRS